MSFSNENLTFEQLPQAVSLLINEVQELKSLLQTSKQSAVEPTDRWLNLQELCNYLPDRPAKQTVYGWIAQRSIPYHKTGKKLQFRQSEIDEWIQRSRRLTASEQQAEAIHYINTKKDCANESRIGTRSESCRVQPTLHEVKGGTL